MKKWCPARSIIKTVDSRRIIRFSYFFLLILGFIKVLVLQSIFSTMALNKMIRFLKCDHPTKSVSRHTKGQPSCTESQNPKNLHLHQTSRSPPPLK